MFVWSEQSRAWYIDAARYSSYHREQAAVCASFLHGLSTVAEFGCGPGFLAMELAMLGFGNPPKDVSQTLSLRNATPWLSTQTLPGTVLSAAISGISLRIWIRFSPIQGTSCLPLCAARKKSLLSQDGKNAANRTRPWWKQAFENAGQALSARTATSISASPSQAQAKQGTLCDTIRRTPCPTPKQKPFLRRALSRHPQASICPTKKGSPSLPSNPDSGYEQDRAFPWIWPLSRLFPAIDKV